MWLTGSDGQSQLVAVLDIDCPTVSGFSEMDAAGLVQWVAHPVVLDKRSDLTDMDDTCVSSKVH